MGLLLPTLWASNSNDLYYLRQCLSSVEAGYLAKANYRYTVSGKRETARMLARFPRYEQTLERILLEEGLPAWLKYVPLAESRLVVDAVSSAGAVGLWQIMPGTARGLGLRVGKNLDERLDVVKASRAAALHLKQLYTEFDSWLLAIAAYNCGAQNVRKAQFRSGGSRYREIYRYLPRQTRRYLPRVLTIAVIGENPTHFGLAVEPATLASSPSSVGTTTRSPQDKILACQSALPTFDCFFSPPSLSCPAPYPAIDSPSNTVPLTAYQTVPQLGVSEVALGDEMVPLPLPSRALYWPGES